MFNYIKKATVFKINYIEVAICFLLGACSRSPEIVFVQPYAYYQYQKGQLHYKKDIAQNSSICQKFVEWCKRNKSGWNSSCTTYAPGKIIKGENFSLNMLNNNLLVLNYKTCDDEWKQFTKELDSTNSSIIDVFTLLDTKKIDEE